MTTMTCSFQDALSTAAGDNNMRVTALARFNERGWPTRRDEAFRYLDLRGVRDVQWALTGASRVDTPMQLDLPGAVMLVFVGGRLDVEASDAMPEGVSIGHPDETIAAQVDPFTDLCLSANDETLCIQVAADTAIGTLHIVHEAKGDDLLSAPRCVIDVAARGSVTVVESITLEGHVLCTPVTEIKVAQGARVELARLINGTSDAWCCGTISTHAAEHAVVHVSTIPFGGAVNRTRLESTLAGESSHVDLRGLGVAGGDRHVETVLSVRHAGINCTSNMLFKHVLGGSATASFTGRINVDKGAHGTDAVQTSRTMLLSPTARAYSRPQLEIYADDVKCTHGSTTGRPDVEAEFYLRARGIDKTTAGSLLVWAFACEVLDELEPAALRVEAAKRLLDQLPGGDALDPTVVAPHEQASGS
jgi:Fe-S cluster assembly protein SufD